MGRSTRAMVAMLLVAACLTTSSGCFLFDFFRGKPGPAGPAGPAGPQGPPGVPQPGKLACIVIGDEVDNQRLAQIDTTNPLLIQSEVAISGDNVGNGEVILAIIFINDRLVGLGGGPGATPGTGRLYEIDKATGATTQLNTVDNIPISNDDVGLCYDPVNNVIHMTTQEEEYLILSPTTGIVQSGGDGGDDTDNLAYRFGDINQGDDPDPVHLACGLDGTVYVIDTDAEDDDDSLPDADVPPTGDPYDFLSKINGTGSVGGNTRVLLDSIGELGLEAIVDGGNLPSGNDGGFDICHTEGVGYAVLEFDAFGVTVHGLFKINLTTGQATTVGLVGLGITEDRVRGLALIQ